jgi:hypothetical protein
MAKMGARTRRKADFELPSAEGDWGYPEDMLIRPSSNGGSVNGNGATPSQDVEGETSDVEVASDTPRHELDQEDAA